MHAPAVDAGRTLGAKMVGSRQPGWEGQLAPDHLDLIAALNGARVEYLMVGAYAMAAHGVVRATGDIDLLYRPTRGNVERLCKALAAFGAPPLLIDPDYLMVRDAVTQIGVPPVRIDLLASITGLTFDQAAAGAKVVEFSGHPVRVIGLDALMRNKRATGREKDAADLRRLAVVKKRQR